jgi:hypothetical protein
MRGLDTLHVKHERFLEDGDIEEALSVHWGEREHVRCRTDDERRLDWRWTDKQDRSTLAGAG